MPSTPPTGQIRHITVDEESAGQRLDNLLVRLLKGVPKSHIYRIIRSGEVRRNKGRVSADDRVNTGDVLRIPPIRLSERAEEKAANPAPPRDFPVVFEDDAFLAIDKPAGIAVHGGSGVSFGVIEQMRQARPEARLLELVHRLDRDTSGCLLIAKKRSILTALHEQLRLKVVEKKYWALVAGQWDGKIKKVTEPLKKNTLQSGERIVRVDERDGKPSETRFKVLQRFAEGTLLEAFPVTGRTHQIRVHTACNGHPIACDDKYGDNEFTGQMNALGLNRLFLHAKLISFQHPVSAERMTFEAPLDKALAQILTKLVKK